MTKEDFIKNLRNKIQDCQQAILDESKEHLLNTVDSRLAFAAGYLETDFEFLSEFFDVILSGKFPPIPF